MKEIDKVIIDKEECPTQLLNILSQCKLTYPPNDPIQKLNVSEIDVAEITFFKRETR